MTLRPLAATLAIAAIAGPAAAAPLKTAVFAGGCFWSMEHDLEPVAGVTDVVSGYAGGKVARPTYQNHAGALEAVRVTYDPAKISYPQLAARYLRATDPTDADGAFCDRGHSYSPAIFVANEAERQAAAAAISAAQPRVKGKIVTRILPASAFTVAEGYHQDYARKNPVAYKMYRVGCGKDRRLKAIWS
ncbi:MAG TPA: peptide-methionine (S)-S-oxide reductase MsrA [Caulobacteraceae bacterium]|jgi:peptide-methionine (S)-S-oxide reductase